MKYSQISLNATAPFFRLVFLQTYLSLGNRSSGSRVFMWFSREDLSTRAGRTPALETQKPAAHVAMRMAFSSS